MLMRRRLTEKTPAKSTGAWRQAAGRNRAMKLGRIVVRLAADGGAALGADVVVLAARRQDQEELLARGRRAAAAGAEEARRLEFLEAVLGPGHRANSTPGPIMPARCSGPAWPSRSP